MKNPFSKNPDPQDDPNYTTQIQKFESIGVQVVCYEKGHAGITALDNARDKNGRPPTVVALSQAFAALKIDAIQVATHIFLAEPHKSFEGTVAQVERAEAYMLSQRNQQQGTTASTDTANAGQLKKGPQR